jgi:LPXTG-motif cell wall-anchored protein
VAGIRTGSDFVLVDAKPAPADAAPSTSTSSSRTPSVAAGTSANCAETGNGEAYRLAGKREGELKPFVGRYIEITGRFEHAHDARAAAGETNAKLPSEILVASYRPASAPRGEPIATATSGQTPTPPSPPSATPAPNAPPVQAARELPQTASNDPLIALVGLVAMSAAIAFALVRRRVA